MIRKHNSTLSRTAKFSRRSCILAGALFLMATGSFAYAEETDSRESEEAEERINPSDFISKFWELEQKDKRGTFVIRTFLPNFFLPAHYTSSVNKQPTSPSRGDAPEQPNYGSLEIKLQISLRTKLWENLLLPNADLWGAYTQVSLWQGYDKKDSRPFRSTDHNPEVIYTVPIPEHFDILPGSARLRMVQAGFAHHSNGQSEPLSRSWNYTYLGGVVEYGEFMIESKWKQRINETGDDDDNPDLVRFRGNVETRVSWLPGRSTASITLITRDFSANRGSIQFDYTYPLGKRPDGIRAYLQLFSGYGETLLDYNHRQNRIGIGFLLLNF
ncbi:outer membrane phospholipase A [Idiomarina sp. A28L]|uniref:phospholipase A n=1 Tax=Idiomarina sp. A28L TaxID=1036674 RepID=UPI000213862E|nr:phospholipase A [Idiomarina sp. A28L]EGN75600.1 outer membrane phospholipase A [Idiomarina sp. A28L]